jgi:prepilin-type processing-associated H-X9-DG protein
VQDGFFGRPPIREADVTDGLSQTAAVGEQVHGVNLPREWDTQAIPTLGYIYDFEVNPPTQRTLISQCQNLSRESLPAIMGGVGARPSGVPWLYTDGYTHLSTPNQASCLGKNLSNVFSPITASSRHRHGVNILFADGHVKFINSTVNEQIWRALGSRNGGEASEF